MNKEEYIKFRVTDAEKKEIQKQAEKVGKSVSEYCRNMALNGEIIYFDKEDKDVFRSYARNLQQALIIYYSDPFKSWSNQSELVTITKAIIREIKRYREKW